MQPNELKHDIVYCTQSVRCNLSQTVQMLIIVSSLESRLCIYSMALQLRITQPLITTGNCLRHSTEALHHQTTVTGVPRLEKDLCQAEWTDMLSTAPLHTIMANQIDITRACKNSLNWCPCPFHDLSSNDLAGWAYIVTGRRTSLSVPCMFFHQHPQPNCIHFFKAHLPATRHISTNCILTSCRNTFISFLFLHFYVIHYLQQLHYHSLALPSLTVQGNEPVRNQEVSGKQLVAFESLYENDWTGGKAEGKE